MNHCVIYALKNHSKSFYACGGSVETREKKLITCKLQETLEYSSIHQSAGAGSCMNQTRVGEF